MKYSYTKNYDTPYSDVDRSGKLGLWELMNLNQDMITGFYGSVGSDNVVLKAKNNSAWIYTRTKVRINQLPFWNTKTKAVAFVTSLSPIRMEIETDLFDENHNLLFVAKTEMCAIDLGERKIRKIDSLEFPRDLEVEQSSISEPFEKMKTEFDNSDLAYTQKVFASDTDFSRHTNNASYVKFLMNTFSSDFYEEKSVSGFEIQFAKETKEGDLLDVFRKETGDHEISFVIKNGDDTVVKSLLHYTDTARVLKFEAE